MSGNGTLGSHPKDEAMLRHDVEPGSHVVHFYADGDALAASVVDYAEAGLHEGQAAVLVAGPAHLRALHDALAARGVDIDVDADADADAHVGAGAGVVVLDAATTLARFMAGARPDPARFAEVLGAALRTASRGRAGVRVYGEMVETLWRRGNVNAALELEELWNQLARELPFSLYCAYRDLLVEGAADDDALDEACRLHSDVLAEGTLMSRSSASARFEAGPAAPAAARAFVLDWLGADATPDLAGRAALTVSELVTNAVRHCGSDLSVTVTRLTHTVRISVRDASEAAPVARTAALEEPSGRGLQIVGALSRHWGTVPCPGGKTVWAELDRDEG